MARKQDDRNKAQAYVRKGILAILQNQAEITSEEIQNKLDANNFREVDVPAVLKQLMAEGIIERPPLSRVYVRLRKVDIDVCPEQYINLVQSGVAYHDWDNHLPNLMWAFENKEFVMMIGPASAGKTEAVRKLSELTGMPLFTFNFSLRTREHELVGRLDTRENGEIYFKPGVMTESMKAGGILYLDELPSAPGGMLLKLNQALDSRREITTDEGLVKAHPRWFVVATMNPLDLRGGGTKQLPPQIMDRFPISMDFKLPIDVSTEYAVIKSIVPEISKHSAAVRKGISVIQDLRQSTDLFYIPGIRASRTIARMIVAGKTLQDALEQAVINRYIFWGTSEKAKVAELVYSLIGRSGGY